MRKETIAVRAQAERSQNREHAVPLYLTSSFLFENAEQGRALFADEVEGNIYSRFSNPNSSELIDKMAQLENCEDGFAFATGMAAVFSIFGGLLESGDHIVASRSLFGSSHQILTKILPKWGITHTYVDAENYDGWEKAITPNTKMIFIETPSNPALEVIDLEFLGALSKKHNLIFSVDNCFATPFIQTPKDFGADLVIHSATKFIDGQGRVLGGVVVGSKELIKEIRFFARQTGPAISPFNAWILSKSLETLSVRIEKHCANALTIAKKLSENQNLENVKYPFLESHPHFEIAKKQMLMGGGIVTFVIKGGYERAQKFIDALQICSRTANLGDSRTIVTHPASTTHSKLSEAERQAVGIFPGLVRVSVGLEHVDDILEDLKQAILKSEE
ncbi:MAG: aminotransferase class I/II-fold pyridoxal phosphate-dependent enzyme [Melioribacteraceae bacterium]|nr:aminotransferase class I/II-fold pyridoxal phosphate-dependent enzyme [Melioribacteraceae bacterium]MCF8264390.1 aminotransferase class I/II-fold pyridoxal phosphate-dependent enzyme [Melioribacteraceae bacterium]MCF8432075.1 aminotransferase class I/II-fold pyridoxal phosphate-dependent enzyme [Melioribacteraceae bacterium]